MALTTIDQTILGALDRLEYQSKAAAKAVTGGTDFWARYDAAGDETFENYMKGFDATALDDAMLAMDFGSYPAVKLNLTNLKSYLATLGYASVDAYLLAKALRVNYRCKGLFAANGQALSLAAVAGDADGGANAPGTAMGSLIRGGTLTAGTDIAATAASPSPALARVTTIGAADWTLSLTMKVATASTKVIVQVVSGTGASGAVGDTYVIGAQAIGGVTAAGQKVVTCADTAQYAVGQTVLLTEWTGDAPDEAWAQQEVGIIASVQTNVSITVTTNLLHAYTTAGFIYPCFVGVSAASGTGGSADDAVTIYPAPERRLKL